MQTKIPDSELSAFYSKAKYLNMFCLFLLNDWIFLYQPSIDVDEGFLLSHQIQSKIFNTTAISHTTNNTLQYRLSCKPTHNTTCPSTILKYNRNSSTTELG